MPPTVPSAAEAPPTVMLCGTGDPRIIKGLLKVTRRYAAGGRSVRLCVSDDAAEQREALFAPVPVIIWDDHGDSGPKVGKHLLHSLLGSDARQITAEALMLGCCWGRTKEFTRVISRYLAAPMAFLGCDDQPGRTHGPLVFSPLLEALAPLTGTGAAPQTLADAMNAALDLAVQDRPVLKSALWKAEVLQPAHA